VPFAPETVRPSFRAARADIADTGTSFKVTADIPGIPKDKLEIRVSGTSVEIRGETEQNAKKAENGYLHRERHYAGFYRTLELPEPVVAKDATAKLENGVLELELPKEHPTPSAEPFKVPVQ
jgi:HSP20 family protein